MKKLYEKSELTFALVCIAAYCVLQSLANPLDRTIGVPYSASAILCALQAAFLWSFLRQNGLFQRYGLCRSSVPGKQFLYHIPLLILMTRNFWNGIAINLPLSGMICYIVCMLCVGFVEEVIFRGLLFKALEKDNVDTAIVISSVTFGLGHLLNLINGSGMGLAENLFQVTGAIAIGFLFVVLFHRGESLYPCVIAHAVINITSAFANVDGLTMERRMIFHVISIAITAGYIFVLDRTLPKKPRTNGNVDVDG